MHETHFDIPDEFFQNQLAIICGKRTLEFWNYIHDHYHSNPHNRIDEEIFQDMIKKYGDDITVACYDSTEGCKLSWCYSEWYRNRDKQICHIDELIVHPIDTADVMNLL